MPIKGGTWTPQERAFTKAMAQTGNAVQAATQAGYRNPHVAAHKLQQREPVMASVRKQVEAQIEGTLVPLALAALQQVLTTDPALAEKYGARVRVDAADKVLKHYRSSQADGEPEKELHELTAAELRQRYEAEKLKLQAFDALVAEAENTIEHEADEAPEPDIFG